MLNTDMRDFKLWIEAIEYRPVRSIAEAKVLSRSSSLDTAGMDFGTIQKALAARREVTYQEMFPLASLANVPAGDKKKTLEMMGAFAQMLGREAPDTLEQSQALAVRGPDFRKMTPPIIVYSDDSGIRVMDGVSRVNAARLLKVSELRAFVIK
jgi:hypothetical protein